MLKTELVFLEIFRGAKTQAEIAGRLGISLSTVNNAIKPLSRVGAVEKSRLGLKLVDKEKALAYWASIRDLEKDTAYKTRAEMGVDEIEKLMPSGVVFTAFTAYKLKFKDTPADYSEVYVYADEEGLEEIKGRFPQRGGPENITVLSKPAGLFAGAAPDELGFVGLLNLKDG